MHPATTASESRRNARLNATKKRSAKSEGIDVIQIIDIIGPPIPLVAAPHATEIGRPMVTVDVFLDAPLTAPRTSEAHASSGTSIFMEHNNQWIRAKIAP